MDNLDWQISRQQLAMDNLDRIVELVKKVSRSNSGASGATSIEGPNSTPSRVLLPCTYGREDFEFIFDVCDPDLNEPDSNKRRSRRLRLMSTIFYGKILRAVRDIIAERMQAIGDSENPRSAFVAHERWCKASEVMEKLKTTNDRDAFAGLDDKYLLCLVISVCHIGHGLTVAPKFCEHDGSAAGWDPWCDQLVSLQANDEKKPFFSPPPDRASSDEMSEYAAPMNEAGKRLDEQNFFFTDTTSLLNMSSRDLDRAETCGGWVRAASSRNRNNGDSINGSNKEERSRSRSRSRNKRPNAS